MSHLIVHGTFDMDAVAAQFPGRLRFRGTPADQPGPTEIEGDVDEAELVRSVHHNSTLSAPSLSIQPVPFPDPTPLPPNPYTRIVAYAVLIQTFIPIFITLIIVIFLHWINWL